MIYQLCNEGYEQIATFFKIAIIKKSSLAFFTHLTPDDDVETIISNLSESANALIINLLPENLSIQDGTRTGDEGKGYQVSIGFTLTPQDKNLQGLLEQYNNEEVVVLLDKVGDTYVYGTTNNPLKMIYSSLHSNTGSGTKGYQIQIKGNTLGAPKMLENTELTIYNTGLAFQLAGQL